MISKRSKQELTKEIHPRYQGSMTFENSAIIHPTTGDVAPADNYASLVLGEEVYKIYLPMVIR